MPASFLSECRKKWLEEQMEWWWIVQESCAFNPSFATSYREQYERECEAGIGDSAIP